MNGKVHILEGRATLPSPSKRVGKDDEPPVSEDRFREVFEFAPFGVCVTGLDTRFLHVNRRLCRMLGYCSEELLGTSWTQLTHPDDMGLSLNTMDRLNREPDGCLTIEKRFIHRGGAVIWVRLGITLARDSGGSPMYFIVNIEDITEAKRANEAMLDSEERFHRIADSCPSMMWATDTGGNVQFFNKACRDFFGVDFEKANRDLWLRYIHPDDLPQFVTLIDRAKKEYKNLNAEARARRADSAWRLLGWRAQPKFSSEGEFLGYIGLCADITERIQAEQARQFELSLIQSIHAETSEGILVVDQAGFIVSYNKRFLDIWGLDEATAQGPQPNSFIGSEDRILMSLVFECLAEPEAFIKRVIELYDHPDAEIQDEINLRDGRTLERHSTGLKNPVGAYLGRVWFFRDISAHKEAELSLQRANALAEDANRQLMKERSILDNERRMLRALIDNIPDFMYVKDTESRFQLANSHVARVVGVESPDALLGKSDFDFYPHEQAMGFFEDEQTIIRSRQPLINREEKALDVAGKEISILTSKVPVFDSDGHIIGIAGVGHDISARKKMEASLREAEQKYRGIFDNAVIGIFQSTPDGRTLSVNPYMAAIYGFDSPDEMIAGCNNIGYQVYVDPNRREEFKHLMENLGHVTNFECEQYHKDKSVFWVSMSAIAIRENEEVVRYEGMMQDITDRRKIEEALREAEQKYRGIFDKAIVGIFQSTPDGHFMSVNSSLAFTLGYNFPEEMIANVTDISQQFFVNPKRGTEFMLIMDKVGGVKNFECEVYCKDGGKIWLTMSIRAIHQDGVVVRYEGMCEDINERKALQGQLLQAQKLESVGQLAAGIAHEINTPTQYIGDNVRFLKDAFQDLKSLLSEYEQTLHTASNGALSSAAIQELAAAVKRADPAYLLDEIPKAIDQTLEGVSRVAKIVGAMKEFSHPGSKEKSPQNLNHAIENTITVARNEWKYVADMATEFDPDLPPIPCLLDEFNQVILNLIVNAAHAIGDVVNKGGPQKGKIKVQTSNCIAWAEIRVQDTGSGIPKSVQSRIFDPFFTTKAIGKGTGQGLAIARSVIVDKHGGSIHFETEEGKGTTFIIRLPSDGRALSTIGVAA